MLKYKLRYFLTTLLITPFLPLLYLEGKRLYGAISVLQPPKDTRGENQQNAKEILILGESTMAGIGAKTHREGFGGHLCETLKSYLKSSFNWNVNARNGFTAKLVETRILPKVPDQTYDIVIIGLGGNDAFKYTSPSKWKSDLMSLNQSLIQRFPSTPIVYLNMPPIEDFPAFNFLLRRSIGSNINWMREIVEDVTSKFENIYFNNEKIILKDWMQRLDNKYTEEDFFSDGVHPSALTYQLWGKETAEYIIREKIIS